MKHSRKLWLGTMVALGAIAAITLATALVSLYFPLISWLENRRVLRRGRSAAVALFQFLDRRGEVGQVVGAEFLLSTTTRFFDREEAVRAAEQKVFAL